MKLFLIIDDTIIWISKKMVANEENYFNKKTYYTINIFMLVDYFKKIAMQQIDMRDHVLIVYINCIEQNTIEGLQVFYFDSYKE